MNIKVISYLVSIGCVMLALAGNTETPPSEHPATPEWGEATEGYQLGLSFDKKAYLPEEPIWVSVVLKNSSDKAQKIGVGGAMQFNAISISGPTVGLIPLTLYGKASLSANRDTSRSTRMLKPGEAVSTSFWISRIYDMSMWGQYTVTVSRIVWKRDNMSEFATVKSNPIVIEVENRTP